MNKYEQRQALRQARLEDRADRLRSEGQARLKRGQDAFAQIPPGQPMMPGHHSYNRDRNFRERARNNITKGYEAMQAADEVARKAAAVGTGGISSDDPEAVDKLAAQLAKLEARQVMMAAVNKLVRKYANDPDTGAAKIAEAYPDALPVTVATELFKPDYAGRKGFAGYMLTNNSANIRRIKERIAALGLNAERETKETTVNGVRMVENAEDNRLQLFFDGKPSENIRTQLKAAGFRWSPSEGAWQRQLNGRAKWIAEDLIKKITP